MKIIFFCYLELVFSSFLIGFFSRKAVFPQFLILHFHIRVYEKDHEPLGKAHVKITGLGVMNHDEPAQSPVEGITNSSGQVVINIDIRNVYSDTPGKTFELTLTITKKGYDAKKVQIPVKLV